MKGEALVILLLIGLLCAGCTEVQTPAAEEPVIEQVSTSVPTAKVTVTATATPVSSPAGEQQALSSPPEDIAVSAQINEKDQIDKTITVIFSGGKGQNLVKRVWIESEMADGRSEITEMKPQVMYEQVLQGSDGEDHVRVYAEYMNGNTYIIGDKALRLRTRM